MSFDLYVLCFRNGEKGDFPRRLVEEYFGQYVSHREPECLTLAFDGIPYTNLSWGDEEMTDCLVINRPVDVPAFNEALFNLLKSGSLVLLVPGHCPPLVGSANAAAQLPADMADSLGAPVVLVSASEIWELIAKA